MNFLESDEKHWGRRSLVVPNSEMFCWGNTVNGELGLGGIEDQHILAPRELIFSEAEQVKDVACGKYHTVLVTKGGAVFSCGNNDYGQLGHNKTRTRLERVDGLNAYMICKVACGESHTLAVNEWGQVFSWGSSSHGQLGLQSDEGIQPKPKIIRSLATSFVVQVSCGYKHCLALTNNGELYAWGCNDYGQLGLGMTSASVPVPSLVTSLTGVPLAFIASGGSHSFAISKSGAVFGWGKNRFGQLGLNSEVDHKYPAQLKTLRSIRVKYIACGEDFSVFLTQDGGVFTCGAGQYGQLGHGSLSNEILPRKVLELMGSTITQISCGRRHTLALEPSRGRVYAFGVGGAGQLGTAAQLNCSTPQVVSGPWVSPTESALDTTPEPSDYVVKRIYAGGDHCFVTVSRHSENIPPDDCRIFPEDSQIWTVKLDQMLICQNLPPDSAVDQDLLTYLETVLSSPACLNASFLLKDDEHYCCSSRNHGVDMKLAQECFNAISRCEHESVRDLIRESLLSNVIPKLSTSPPDVEALRIYLILPLYHEYSNAKHVSRFQEPFGSSVLALKAEAARVIGLWYLMMSAEYFERLIFVYKSVVLHLLRLQGNRDKQHIQWSGGMVTALEVLSRLNKLNQSCCVGIKEEGLKVPYDTFYMTELSDYVDICTDYVYWIYDPSENMPDRMNKRHFCNYPFLFDAQAKTLLLQTDQSLQMHSAMNEAATRQIRHFMMFVPVSQPSVSQFVELHVTRENIVQDTLRELSHYGEKDLKKPLKVTFLGEEAEDAGGVKKEFFMLLLREILDPKYGMFRSYEETNTIWFSEDSFEDEVMYYLIGLICGLAIYNFTIIALPFPLVLYKKLLGEPVVLQDVKGLSPSVYKSLQDLLDYEEPDLQEVFCINFEVTKEVFGEIKVHPLKPGGEKIPVTQENKQEFVELYVDYLLNSSVARHFAAFRDAFHKVCGGRVLQLFQGHELMAVVIGNENYDWDVLESNAQYKGGYSSSDPTIRMFWDVFHELSLEEKKKFLLFLTGSDRIPIQGMSAIKIVIQPTTDDKYLPVAHTCFNLLDLPRYGTKEKLRYKLLQAIQQTQGFSLV